MMELKVVCNCGQKYKFDVEPVNQSMPFAVNCPVCGIDGTHVANGMLAQMPATLSPPPVLAAPPPPTAAIAPPSPPRAAPATASRPAPAMAGAPAGGSVAIPKYLQTNKATQNNNFALGIVGAVLGAVVGIGLMVGFYMFAGFKFPLTGTLIGALIGGGARLMYRGTSSSLGAMSAALAFVTIPTTLYLMFGIVDILLSGLISLVIGCGMAFKIASD